MLSRACSFVHVLADPAGQRRARLTASICDVKLAKVVRSWQQPPVMSSGTSSGATRDLWIKGQEAAHTMCQSPVNVALPCSYVAV